MGCGSSRGSSFNIEAEYIKIGVPLPDNYVFENEFEKHAYMTINILRFNPKVFIPQIKALRSKIVL